MVMQILGGLEYLVVRQFFVSFREGRVYVRKWVFYGRRVFIFVFILGLENFIRKDSGGYGGVESCGGTSVLQGFSVVCVQLGFFFIMCSVRFWGVKFVLWFLDYKVFLELCTVFFCGIFVVYLGSGGRGVLGVLFVGRVYRVQVFRGLD